MSDRLLYIGLPSVVDIDGYTTWHSAGEYKINFRDMEALVQLTLLATKHGRALGIIR